jgi:hypothetical protein
MSELYDRFWIRIAIVFTAAVIVIGFPIFQSQFDFPVSIIWAFALVLAIWIAYFIRAYLLYRFKKSDI